MEITNIFELNDEQIEQYYCDEWPFNGFLNINKTKSDFIDELKKNPKAVQAVIGRCELQIGNQFVYQMDWDMERSNIPVVMPLGEIDWHLIPFGDQEWMFMLNRHSFLNDLVLGYLLTGEKKYANYIHDFLLESIKFNPLTEKTQRTTWRTLDVGIRLLNWVKILEVFLPESLFSPEELRLVLKSIEEQMNYLNSNLRITRSNSNWQVLELMGLLSACVAFKEIPKANEMKINGLYFLQKALPLQVEVDGLQREQSFMYHNEVLLGILQIITIYQRNNQILPNIVLKKAKEMAVASAKVMKPDGTQAPYGDSDVESMVGILQLAEYILEIPLLPNKFKDKIDFFVYSYAGLVRTKDLNTTSYLPKSSNFSASGLSILRNADNTCYTLFKCGSMGGGHGHDDQLHVEIYCNGETFLSDAGRYSYDIQHERLVYRGAQMHNTVIVDNQNFNEHPDVWSMSKMATPINHHFYEDEEVKFCEGGHLGYFDLQDPTLVNRKVVFLEEGVWLIFDELFCHKTHDVMFPFHFPDSKISSLEGRKFEVSVGSQALQVISFDEEKAEVYPWIPSFHYNEKNEGRELRFSRTVTENTVSLHAFSDKLLNAQIKRIPLYTEGREVDQREAEAIQINFGSGKEKIIIVQHVEPNYGRLDYVVNNVHCYGRLIVLTKEKDDYKIHSCF